MKTASILRQPSRWLFAAAALASASAYAALPSSINKTVIVVLENHAYEQINGSSDAPYLNSLASQGAKFTQSYGITHPSQPNYLALFSGSKQGVTDDSCPHSFTTANLGAQLLNAGKTFVAYSQDLPSVGSTVCVSNGYARKHNPWVNWQGSGSNGIPSSSNQPFSAFPTDFTTLPKVSFVIPDQDHDMHNGSDPSRITTADTWIQNKLDAYVQWAKNNNSLLIVTFDEDDRDHNNRIFTIFVGEPVQPGNYSQTINHYDVLRTIEALYGLSFIGQAANATTITNCWK